MRGARCHTDKLWAEINARSGLKHYEYLEYGVSRTFIGVSLLKFTIDSIVAFLILRIFVSCHLLSSFI